MANNKVPRSKYLAIMLYPDFDASHALVLDYIRTNEVLYPEIVYITHDKDLDSEEFFEDFSTGVPIRTPAPLKKKHIHMFIECSQPVTASGFLKRFVINNRPVLHYVELISDPIAYLQYILHIDFASMCDPSKHQYNRDELRGSEKWISRAFELNSTQNNWEALRDMYSFIRDHGLQEFFVSAVSLPPKQSYQLWQVYRCNQSMALKADQAYICSTIGRVNNG